MATPYRIVAAALGWFALILQYFLPLTPGMQATSLEHLVRYFCFFTILSNLLVALALTLPWLAPGTRAGRFFLSPSVRAGIAAYIILVAGVYHLLLRHVWDPHGWLFVSNGLLHYVMPVVYVADWLMFVPKGGLRVRDAAVWLIFPVAYAVLTLVDGAFTGFYPYPFLNVGKFGYAAVLANIAALTVAFAILGLILVAADRALGRAR
jgi:hypothetical protein